MDLNEMIFISVDDHVVEPPDMFDGRLPAKYADQAPKVVRTDAGDDVWVFDGTEIPNIGLNAVAGRPREEYGVNPTSFEEMRPGCYDIHERVKDMSAGGVLACMCFPSFPSFSGRLFADVDRQGPRRSRSSRAYNDWHIDEWCGTHPGRMIPMALPMLWDPELLRRGDPPRRRQGLPLAHVHREPRRARLPQLPQRPLGPDVARRWSRTGRSSTSTSVRRASSRSPRPTRRWT